MRRRGLSFFFAFLFFQLFLLPSCSNMGSGADPVNSLGVFSFLLPPAISPDSSGAKEGEPLEEGEAAPPAGKDETVVALPIEEDEEEGLAEGGEAESEREGDDEAAADGEAGEGLVPVSRYYLYLVSATGFEENEILEPSDEPRLFTVQAGQWKILAIAEDEEGRMITRRELNGISLSAEEEKAVPLDWQKE